MHIHKLKSFHKESMLEAGCDEAGRGCLAGPVFAAAVILPNDFYHPLLNDSKKINEKTRELLRPIIESLSPAWAVACVSAREIDQMNILNASILAMHRALEKLALLPRHIIVDGNRFKEFHNISHTCVVGGDGKYASIAAASILAKTHRDQYMKELAKEYPGYGWEKNMAYPTKAHREAIEKLGTTEHHRLSFRLKSELSEPE
ncbi:MAG: ribonuclease HII [Bacteroidales bacterium]